MTHAKLQDVVLQSFLTEVNALKPGNVSRYTAGHGMTVDDFVTSATLVTPILCQSDLTLGERILRSVKITMREVGCNTNLGMLLLFAPVIMAAENAKSCNYQELQIKLQALLENISQDDSTLVFQAIRIANPGGLGQSAKFDVHLEPECGLLAAMSEAENRDFIAKQYVTDFADVFLTGYECIKEFTRRWNSVEWATVACYLTFLAGFADTHIQRKHGPEVAEQTKFKAIPLAEQFKKKDDPEDALNALLDFDKELKNSNINPGTTADLTAASLLVYGVSSL